MYVDISKFEIFLFSKQGMVPFCLNLQARHGDSYSQSVFQLVGICSQYVTSLNTYLTVYLIRI